MIFRSLAMFIAFITVTISHVAFAATPDGTVLTEMRIYNVQEFTQPVTKSVPCRNKQNDLEVIAGVLGTLFNRGAPVQKSVPSTEICQEVVNLTTYAVTVEYEHEGRVKYKIFRNVSDYPGRKGDMFPVAIDIHVRMRDQ